MSFRRVLSSFNNIADCFFGMRFQPSSEARLSKVRMRLIEEFECDTVIDVGANAGQWARKLRKSGYLDKIISYEPSNVFHELKENAKGDFLWSVKQEGLSDYSGIAPLYIASNNGLSSSFLKPKEILNQHSQIKFDQEIKTPVRRLDQDVFNSNRIYLKIDTQGSEYQVLRGAERMLSNISIIEFESALIQLYEGETNHYFIASWLIENGFEPVQVVATHWDRGFTTISIDAIFVKVSSQEIKME